MRSEKHRKDVEKTFRTAVRRDRARSRILRISPFGVVEMTRQRMRPSLQSSTSLACPNCAGSGFVKSRESLSIEIIRLLNLSAWKKQIKRIELFVSPEVADYLQNEKRAAIVSPEVADYLQNEKRAAITQIEQMSDKRVIIHSAPSYAGEKHNLVCYSERGSVVKL
jgi:ribonuclease E